jgi:hypothetical protein
VRLSVFVLAAIGGRKEGKVGQKVVVERIFETTSKLFGGYRATVPDLGIEVCGETEDECLNRVMEEIARRDRKRRTACDF